MQHPNLLCRSNANQIVVALLLTFLILLQVKGSAQMDPRGIRLDGVPGGNALDGRGKLWAVVIGVSNYRHLSTAQQLQYAHRDAQEFAAFLRTPGGGGFPASQLRVMLNQEATLAAVKAELGTMLPGNAQPDDVVVIFFAGHGIVEGERDGYLLLHDSDPNNLYSTALQLSELNRIVTERVRARNVILITDACHAGQLGWAPRGTPTPVTPINTIMAETSKSGEGVFRLLASRAKELSYEDKRWGGGHGVFTHYLLEGLKGAADRDKDGVVRATEVLDYLSDVVPKATNSLQHPQGAGLLDPTLPMAFTKARVAPVPTPVVVAPEPPRPIGKLVKLEVRGAAGSEVYVDNTLRGRIGRSGALVVEKLNSGKHEVVVQLPGGEKLKQSVNLEKDHKVIEVNKTTIPKPPSLAEQISQALVHGQLETALQLYGQLLRTEPNEPQRAKIEAALSLTIETIGQKVVTDYLQSPLTKINHKAFRQGAEAYKWLKLINAGQTDPQQEVKYLFCEGRALIEEGHPQEALGHLEKATTLDPKAAHVWNAVGLAYDKLGRIDRATEAYKQAAQLAPIWGEPQYYLGALYLRIGQHKPAEQPLLQAAKHDPNSLEPRCQLVRMWRMKQQWKKAEAEAAAILGAPEANPNEYYAGLYADVWYELAQVYEATKRYANAAEAYEKVLTLMPGRTDREQLAEKARKLRDMLTANKR